MDPKSPKRPIVGIGGASGIVNGVRTLAALKATGMRGWRDPGAAL